MQDVLILVMKLDKSGAVLQAALLYWPPAFKRENKHSLSLMGVFHTVQSRMRTNNEYPDSNEFLAIQNSLQSDMQQWFGQEPPSSR